MLLALDVQSTAPLAFHLLQAHTVAVLAAAVHLVKV
jgi:hypothetical protein